MIVDQFEELLEASEKQLLVFSLSLHGFKQVIADKDFSLI